MISDFVWKSYMSSGLAQSGLHLDIFKLQVDISRGLAVHSLLEANRLVIELCKTGDDWVLWFGEIIFAN